MILASFAANAQVAINKDGSAPDSSTILHVKGGGDHFFKIDNSSGDISMEGEINRTAQGQADLLPLAYGSVFGTSASGTSGISVVRNASGEAVISMTGITFSTSDIIVLAPLDGLGKVALHYSIDNNNIKVKGYDITTGNLSSLPLFFSFIVFRP